MNYTQCGSALALPYADGIAQTCVTSPPYYGLRDYGTAGQIGLEQTPAEYVAKLVEVFREVRRVLRDDGTVWLNLGDSYNGSGGAGGDYRPGGLKEGQPKYPGRRIDVLKPKDLIGIPWRVALALQADGWYLRSDIIWHKPNPMPESVTDRPTKSHEYLFLLSKSERYYYDSEAIKEPSITDDMRRPYGSEGAWQMDGRPVEHRPNGQLRGKAGKNAFRGQGAEREGATGPANRDGRDMQDVGVGTTRNKRSVWTVATKPYKEAHFATYPVDLVEPCIKAGTSAHGCCEACGAPWVRVVERTKAEYTPCNGAYAEQHIQQSKGKTRSQAGGMPIDGVVTTGWSPSCSCGAPTVPCVVLDTFSGSGTTGVAAIGLGRNYIGIELNPEYIKLAERRLQNTQPALIAAD
jgi:DNA modification methylase